MIKNLLFDLGGVIMDIRKEDCIRSYELLGLDDAASYFGEYSQTGVFMALEAGQIGPDEFHAELHRHLPAHVTDAQIDKAFCDFLTGIPAARLAALRQLRRRFKVCLLSNTNPIMWDSKIAECFRAEGREREDYFDGMVTSFAARCLKPGREIFDYAVRTLDLDPAETLFLDDSQANVEAARALGFNAAVVPPGTEFTDIIARITTA